MSVTQRIFCYWFSLYNVGLVYSVPNLNYYQQEVNTIVQQAISECTNRTGEQMSGVLQLIQQLVESNNAQVAQALRSIDAMVNVTEMNIALQGLDDNFLLRQRGFEGQVRDATYCWHPLIKHHKENSINAEMTQHKSECQDA